MLLKSFFHFVYSHLNFTFFIMFLCQIFKVKIFMDLQILRSPESENHIFLLLVYVWVPSIRITQKQIIPVAPTPNLVFYFSIICRCYLKFLWRSDRQSAHKTKNSNTLWLMEGISCYWICVYVDCTKYNKNKMHIAVLKNMWTTE